MTNIKRMFFGIFAVFGAYSLFMLFALEGIQEFVYSHWTKIANTKAMIQSATFICLVLSVFVGVGFVNRCRLSNYYKIAAAIGISIPTLYVAANPKLEIGSLELPFVIYYGVAVLVGSKKGQPVFLSPSIQMTGMG